MTAIQSLGIFFSRIREHLSGMNRIQIASASEAITQMLIWDLLYRGGLDDESSFKPDTVVVVVAQPKDISSWLVFSEYLGACRVGTLPYLSMWGHDRFINPTMVRRQRINSLSKISDGGLPSVIITTLMGLGQKTFSKRFFLESAIRLLLNREFDQDDLVAKLYDLGYSKTMSVEEEGTFALRGGILDVWSPSTDFPVRVEFIGDTVASLRFFSVDDQKSRENIKEALFVPAIEAFLPDADRAEHIQKLFNVLIEQNIKPSDRDGMIKALRLGLRFPSLDVLTPLFRRESQIALDFFGPRSVLIFPTGFESSLNAYRDFLANSAKAEASDRDKGRVSLGVEEHFCPPELLEQNINSTRSIEFGNPFVSKRSRFYQFDGQFSLDGAPSSQVPTADLFDRWIYLIQEIVVRCNGSVAILAHNQDAIDRIRNLLSHRDLQSVEEKDLPIKIVSGSLRPKCIVVGIGELSSHIWLDERNLLVIPETALFGARSRKSKPASVKLKNYLSSFSDLKVSDLVVHIQHGIGRYQGLATITVADVTSDFLILEYFGGDKIYLPVDRLGLLQKYSAGSGVSTDQTLDKLGGGLWDRRKSSVKDAVEQMADQLLKVQAKRALARGFSFGGADDIYYRFESTFPYEETDDQLRAISDIEADLRSGKQMDRLVCGDVGFGKTEVAMRAAMRAVLEGYQTLILVPTTVLCYQHFLNFSSRLAQFGVKVAQVNRFVKSQELKAALYGLENGTVDILIGTHRLLSKDVKPRRLGLLVIDEEQRFGVGHKEKLKQLRAGAHVLTLTATPIPRTLHMAMVGLRDISIIATPPQDRLSVKTHITRFDEELIREVLANEIARGGQVFFVHNRVEDIDAMRLLLNQLVPHLQVRVAHGKMRERDLEQVIVEFIEQKFHILLCTTIIESGIDMPNVNTMIVHRADQFGLSQLYQLRGRVGRSTTQAYAYFLTPPEDRLSDDARQRLAILAAHQELGAGFQIASHDLELRGAGNLLGGEQSGHAAAVGLELYTEMLGEAIAALKGAPVEERVDAEIKIPVSARIPDSYIAHENERLANYKSIFATDSEEELQRLRDEMNDRYGKPPIDVDLLFVIARVKQLLQRIGCVKLIAGKDACELRFKKLSEKQIYLLTLEVRRRPEIFKLTPDYRLYIALEFGQHPKLEEQILILGHLIEYLNFLCS